MPDYQQGKIYKITSGNLTYIGSTCRTLEKRLKGHISSYQHWCSHTHLRVCRAYLLIETGSYIITLIETYPCNSKKELECRERFYIENTVCVNKNLPTRSKNEGNKKYYQDHKNDIQTKKHLWYEANKERLLAKAYDKYHSNAV